MKTIQQLRQDHIDTKAGEQNQLEWFDALFTTIKSDLDAGKTHKARTLADLGQYLAQDLAHYCEQSLDILQRGDS